MGQLLSFKTMYDRAISKIFIKKFIYYNVYVGSAEVISKMRWE